MSQIVLRPTTVPAFPLGQPVDGRPRYGMTPDMARTYRWLIENRPHDDLFRMSFREIGKALGVNGHPVHASVAGLVERGWLIRGKANGGWTEYRFVHPVMRFKEPRDAA
jgi:predicted DNA-binding transcriptional regulator